MYRSLWPRRSRLRGVGEGTYPGCSVTEPTTTEMYRRGHNPLGKGISAAPLRCILRHRALCYAPSSCVSICPGNARLRSVTDFLRASLTCPISQVQRSSFARCCVTSTTSRSDAPKSTTRFVRPSSSAWAIARGCVQRCARCARAVPKSSPSSTASSADFFSSEAAGQCANQTRAPAFGRRRRRSTAPQRPPGSLDLESESLAERVARRCKRAIVQPRPQRSRRRLRRTRAPTHWLARLIATRAPRSRTALTSGRARTIPRSAAHGAGELADGGEIVALRKRGYPLRNPRFVVLIDASRSMERARTRCSAVCVRAVPAARYAASAFVFAARRFSEITRDLRRGRLGDLGAAWGGGARIGASLEHLRAYVSARASTIAPL